MRSQGTKGRLNGKRVFFSFPMTPCASPKSRLEKEAPGYAAGQSPCRGGNEPKGSQ